MDSGEQEQADVLGLTTKQNVPSRMATIVEPGSRVLSDIETMLDGCRERLEAFFGLTLAAREGPGFIRYPPGGYYRPHRDRSDSADWTEAARRSIALVVFLNTSRQVDTDGDFDGGVLRLFLSARTLDVLPEAGLLVAFPADVLHEVTEVRRGSRDAIVDWFYAQRMGTGVGIKPSLPRRA